jgi:pyruvate/2-oxoacid:ferredoxin oxidoreductase alpha subunit
MGSVNSPNNAVDRTVKIFDQFYDYEVTVPQLEYDAVYSYFQSVFENKQTAGNFTVTLFRISEQSAIPVMSLLQSFQGMSEPELTVTLAYYLNGVRSPATLLGINSPTQPNFYVARNVRA